MKAWNVGRGERVIKNSSSLIYFDPLPHRGFYLSDWLRWNAEFPVDLTNILFEFCFSEANCIKFECGLSLTIIVER